MTTDQTASDRAAVEMIRRICPAHLDRDEYGRLLAGHFTAYRAAVLREVEQAVRMVASNCAYDSAAGCEFCNGVDAALEQIRRLADGAQQPEAEAHVWATVPASDAYGRLVGHTWTRCTICGQTQQTTTDQPDAEPEAQQPEAEVRPQRVQCGDCGAVGPVITEGGLAYLDPSGQIGHHAQPGTGGVCVFGTGRPQAEGAQR